MTTDYLSEASAGGPTGPPGRALGPQPPAAPELPGRRDGAIVPRRRRCARLHAVGHQPARHGARGRARRPAVRPLAGPPDRGAHGGRPAAAGPRRDDRGPAPGRPRRPRSRTRRGRPARCGWASTRASAPGSCRRSSAASAQAWPAVEVQLSEAASDEGLMDMVEPGRLDLTFGVLPMPDGPFDGVELLRDPFVLVVPVGVAPRGARGRRPRCSSSASSASSASGPAAARKWVEQQLRAAGQRAELRVPLRGQRDGPGDGRRRPRQRARAAARRRHGGSRWSSIIPTDLAPRRIALMWHRDRYRSPAARAFVEIAQRGLRDPARWSSPRVP